MRKILSPNLRPLTQDELNSLDTEVETRAVFISVDPKPRAYSVKYRDCIHEGNIYDLYDMSEVWVGEYMEFTDTECGKFDA